MICHANPPPPDGFRIWRKPVPQPLVDWAVFLRDFEMPKVNYGFVWSDWYGPTGSQKLVSARKDYHSWTYRGGKLVTDICIPGITLYDQIPTLAQTSYDPMADTLDQPDPNAAVFSQEDRSIDWGLVLATGAAGVGVVTLFLLALRSAGKSSGKRLAESRRRG
jgi:hypothetical protein